MSCYIRNSLLFILLSLALACSHHKTILSDYHAKSPLLFFYTDSLLIETDTTVLMPLLRKYYTGEWGRSMQSEILYRIKHSRADSVWMDGLSMNLYENEKRTAFTCAVINHQEVIYLIKKGKTMLYNRSNRQRITRIRIQRTGSKRKNYIDEIYYDALTGKLLLKRNVYERTQCRLPI